MDIHITGRNMELDGKLKEYVFKRVGKLEHLYRHIFKCDVVLESTKTMKNAEIIVHIKGNQIVAKESTPDIYASVDNAVDTMQNRLRRMHGRMPSKRRRGMLSRLMNPFSFFGQQEEEASGFGSGDETPMTGQIIKTSLLGDKAMSPDEAKSELDFSGNAFIMFKNSETGKANLLYRKNDGNHGLIEPKF